MFTTDEISETLYSYLSSFDKRVILNIMIAALDEMEGYNGQSKQRAIHRALGSEEVEKVSGITYIFPKREEIIKNFS